MIVMKFGGSSIESAEAIRRVAAIVRDRLEQRPVVVVSAMGKTTDALLSVAANAAAGKLDAAMERLRTLREFHEREGASLVAGHGRAELDALLESHFQELTALAGRLCAPGKPEPVLLDEIASYGELLSSRIVALAFDAAGMRSAYLDARRLVVTDARHTQAAPLLDETYARVRAAFAKFDEYTIGVLGGFIGATEEGVTTTLGRGGSDFTAALVGAALGADEIQIWTDVDGVLSCDPALVPHAHPVKTISFDEAAELAYFGAKVLHPATVAPARESNIPIRILNSRRPEAPGTQIVADRVVCKNVLKSLACKRNITVVNITSSRMLMAYGFLRRIFEVFERYETPVDMVATSEVSVSLTIDNPQHLAQICDELTAFSQVRVEQNQAILCAVGDNLRSTPGVAARVFTALREINVRMISEGASLLNLGVVVSGEDLARAAAALHGEFFAEFDPAVFN